MSSRSLPLSSALQRPPCCVVGEVCGISDCGIVDLTVSRQFHQFSTEVDVFRAKLLLSATSMGARYARQPTTVALRASVSVYVDTECAWMVKSASFLFAINYVLSLKQTTT